MNSLLVRMANSTGRAALRAGNNLLTMGDLFLSALWALMRTGKGAYGSLAGQISRQLLYTGVEAFWLVSVIAFICGSTIVIQAMTNMPKFGISDYFGKILVIVVVRELGPFFTSLVVIGRSGAALAAHIGTMRVNKEVAALEVMGINPVYFLVVPALAGMVGAIICLNVYFDVVAIIGGLLVTRLTSVDVPLGIFLGKVAHALSATDIMISVVKSTVFGCIIGVVSCHYGLLVTSVRGVPQAAIKSVVSSMVGTILVNVLVTILMVMLGFYAR